MSYKSFVSTFSAFAVLFFTSTALAQEERQRPPRPPAPIGLIEADVQSIDSIMAALYDVISGPAGDRDYDRLRSLFALNANMAASNLNNPEGITRMTVEGYVRRAGAMFRRMGFFEVELNRITEQYGNVAHVYSTYESRRDPSDAEPFDRGINSIQLFHDGERWWIHSLIWESERSGHEVPEKYLGD